MCACVCVKDSHLSVNKTWHDRLTPTLEKSGCGKYGPVLDDPAQSDRTYIILSIYFSEAVPQQLQITTGMETLVWTCTSAALHYRKFAGPHIIWVYLLQIQIDHGIDYMVAHSTPAPHLVDHYGYSAHVLLPGPATCHHTTPHLFLECAKM